MIRKDRTGRAEEKGINTVPIQDRSMLAWSSHDPNFKGGTSNAPDPDIVAEINRIQNGLNTNTLQTTSLNVWREAQAATHRGNYPQMVMEAMQKAANSKHIISTDIETLGTRIPSAGDTMDFFTPTEITLQHVQVGGKHGARVMPGRIMNKKYGRYNSLTLAINPGEANGTKLQQLINRLYTPDKHNIKLSRDEHRTLQDLILYSDPANFNETKIGSVKVTTLLKQSREKQLIGHASLVGGSTIAKIQAGLDNLLKMGTTPQNAAIMMDQFMNDVKSHSGDVPIVGHNIYAFDKPAILDWLESNIGKDNANSKIPKVLERLRKHSYIDTLMVQRTLRRNPGVLSDNLTLGELANKLGVMSGRRGGAFVGRQKLTHFSPYDTEMGGRVFDKQMHDYHSLITKSAKPLAEIMRDSRFSKFNQTPYKVGDQLFSISGMAGYNAGKYDVVMDRILNPKTKQYSYAPSYIMKNSAPLYNNANYTLTGQYEKVLLGGKEHYAVMLHNKDRDTHHFIARENLEDLQNVFHRNLTYVASPLDRKEDRTILSKQSKIESAARRWNKMFSTESGGGVNLLNRMQSALAGYEEFGKGSGREHLQQIVRHFGGYQDYQTKKWIPASKSFYRDFMNLKDRLKSESPYINDMVMAMQNHPALANNIQAQNIGLRNFKLTMDDEFGRNMTAVPARTSFRSVLELSMDSKIHHLNVSSNLDAVSQNLSNIVYAGHIKENMTPGVLRNRLTHIVGQMKAMGAITGAQKTVIKDMISNISGDQGAFHIIQVMAGRLDEARLGAHDRNAKIGIDTIDIEDPTKLVSQRRAMLKNATHGYAARSREITNVVMQDTLASAAPGFDGMVIHPGSILDTVLNEHDQAIDRMLSKAGIGADSGVIRAKNVRNALNDMLGKYVGGDVGASLFYSKHSGLKMALYNKNIKDQIIGARPDDVFKMNNVAMINIPMISKNGELVTGSSRRNARLKAFDRGEHIMIGSGFDEVINKLSGMSNSIKKMFASKSRNPNEIGSLTNTIIRKTVEDLSVNNTHTVNANDHSFKIRKSMSANWNARQQIDLHALTKRWFTQTYGSDHTDAVVQIMDNGGHMDFHEAMGQYKMYRNDRRVDFSREFNWNIDSFMKDLGINTNAHSTKNILVGNSVRSTRNVSELYPFGFYNQMAGERMMKSVNYMPLDSDYIRKNLSQDFSQVDIDRMTKRGIVTREALDELHTETNFLSLRTAYMNSADVAKKFNSPYKSTFEGMFIMREDIAKGFNIMNHKEIKLTEGAKLTDEIERRFQLALGHAQGTAFDYTKSFVLDENARIEMPGLNKRKNGKVTVSELVTDGVKTGRPIDYYKDPQHKVFLRGWDAEKNKLLYAKEEAAKNGDKFLTTGGHRATLTIATKKEMEAAGMGDIEAIFDSSEYHRRLYGTEVDSYAQLGYDAMRRHVTAGKIALADGLQTLQSLMNTHLHTKGKLQIVHDQLVIDHLLGMDTKQEYSYSRDIHPFLKSIDDSFGTDFLKRQYRVGQVGVARSDTSNWENRIGAVEEGELGNVRWGLKEIDMIQSRLDRHAANGIETSEISKWLNTTYRETARAQNPEAERLSNAYTRAIITQMEQDKHGFHPGDVIIRTHAEVGEFGLDNTNGKRHGIIDSNNVIHVHANAFEDMPQRSALNQKFTIQDYQRTIITMGDNKLPIKGGKGSIGDAIRANHSSAILQLPEGLNHKYVRLVGQDLASYGSNLAVVKDIQRSQSQIWQLTKQYTAPTNDKNIDLTDIKDKLNAELDIYHGHVNHLFSSAREGSLAKTLMSAHMDMAGRFKIQGINPMETIGRAGISKYEEATTYISRDAMHEMIKGEGKNASRNYHNIARTLFSEEEYSAIKHIKGRKFQDKVLDKITQDGLYGFTGRYPSINEDTLQIMKVKIDPSLPRGSQSAYLTVGTAMKLKADNDGDFLSNAISHYKISSDSYRNAIHQQLGDIWAADKKRIEDDPKINAKLMELKNHMEGNAKMKQFNDMTMNQVAAQRKLTVAELMRDPDFMDQYIGHMNIQSGIAYDAETLHARLGQKVIGYADNTRQKLLNITSGTTRILTNNNKMSLSDAQMHRARIEEFGRVLSQDSISSKKFNIEEMRAAAGEGNEHLVIDQLAERHLALNDFVEGLHTPNSAGIAKMRNANSIIKLFDEGEEFNNQLNSISTMYNTVGDDKWLRNKSLHYAVSEGKDGEANYNFIMGKNVVQTPASREFHDALDPNQPDTARVKASVLANNARNERTILANFDRSNGSLNSFFGSSASREIGEGMLGNTSATKAGDKWKNLTDQLGSVFGGHSGKNSFGPLKIGAAVFGGVLAGGMMSSSTDSTRTPEGMRQNIAQVDNPTNMPASPITMDGPTARVAMNGENLQMHVSGKGDMSQEQIAGIIHGEMTNMSATQLNLNMNVQDNSQNINKQWLQQTMANALTFGHAFN